VHEPGSGHRFNGRGHRLPELGEPIGQRRESSGIRCRGGHRDRRARLVHGMHIQTSPAQIQPNVQHEDRASFRHTCRLSPQA
jgi:hypothetical protein